MSPAEILAYTTIGLRAANELIALYIRVQEAAQAGDMDTAQAELAAARSRYSATMAELDAAIAAREARSTTTQ